MKYIAQSLAAGNLVNLTADVGLDSYTMLCRSQQGDILAYAHEENYPRTNEFELEADQIAQKVARLTTPFTLIPATDFDPNMLPRIAKEAFAFDQIDHIHHFRHNDMVGVYHVTGELKSKLVQYFSDFEIQHSVQSLLRLHEQHNPSVLAHWTASGLMLIAYRDGLQLANYYKIDSPEDAIYYILTAYKHINLNPLSHPLSMSGRITKDSILFEKISGFVRDFTWMNQQQTIENFPFENHFFYHLL